MLTYFDESYGTDHLFLGALFLPSLVGRQDMHRKFITIKKNEGYTNRDGTTKEIKYFLIQDLKTLKIAKKAVDLFFSDPYAYFRACVLPAGEADLNMMRVKKGTSKKLLKAIIYTESTINLLRHNMRGTVNGVLLMDELTKVSEDKFDLMVTNVLGSGANPAFKQIGYVQSHQEVNHLIQICDLLLGAIYNDHYPTTGKTGIYKNQFREYVKKKLGVSSLKKDFWKGMSRKNREKYYRRYNISFWETPHKQK